MPRPSGGLETLLPEYRAQYDALMPEIERSVMEDLVRRGMTHSGDATDALARARAKVLAELASKSAESRIGQEESALNRSAAAGEASAGRGEARRAQNMGLAGAGLGALTTLGGMYAMNRPQKNIFVKGDEVMQYDPESGMVGPVPTSPGAAPAAGAAPQSMWQKASGVGLGGLAAGAGGGLLGNRLAELAGGRTSAAGGLGAGAGGLAGGLAGLRMAQNYKSPWASAIGLGLGALGGSFGGGLLGNLFGGR